MSKYKKQKIYRKKSKNRQQNEISKEKNHLHMNCSKYSFQYYHLIVESGKKLNICSKNCPTTAFVVFFIENPFSFLPIKTNENESKTKTCANGTFICAVNCNTN